jgi:hypothetical protein
MLSDNMTLSDNILSYFFFHEKFTPFIFWFAGIFFKTYTYYNLAAKGLKHFFLYFRLVWEECNKIWGVPVLQM